MSSPNTTAKAASVKRNYLYSLSVQLLSIIVPLVTTPYVSRVLGPDGVGAYSFADSVVSYFVLFAVLGTSSYGQRQISYVQQDGRKRGKVFWNTFALRLVTACLCLAAYAPFAMTQEGSEALFLILALSIVNVAADVTWFFQGVEDFKTVAIRNAVVKLGGVALIFAFVKSSDDLCAYALVMMLSTLAGSLSVWPRLVGKLERPRLSELRPFSGLGTVLSLFVPTVAISIYTVLDKTMIGVITADAFENGYYEQAMKIAKMALTIVTSLGAVMASRVGSCYANGDTGAIREYMIGSFRFLWMLSLPLCLGLVGIAPSFVPWFFGEGYDKVVPLLQISSALIPVIGVSNVIGIQLLVPTGRQRFLTLSVCLGALCNFGLNLTLIPMWQSLGAAMASVAAECVVSIAQLLCIRKELPVARLFSCGARNLAAALVMLLAVLLLSTALETTIAATALQVATGMAVYSIMLLILRDDFFKSQVVTPLLGKLKR